MIDINRTNISSYDDRTPFYFSSFAARNSSGEMPFYTFSWWKTPTIRDNCTRRKKRFSFIHDKNFNFKMNFYGEEPYSISDIYKYGIDCIDDNDEEE